MNLNTLHKEICMAIFTVIEICYHQGNTTTWRDIFLFLRLPENIWADDSDLDEKIIITSDEELEIVRDLLLSKFNTLH
ncbi:hypothetical protein EB118_16980 [bacterium]|nr:hypothetical protein [bacterium]NDG79915.1 hypothetical protein [Synechococcaceae bacterium WB8_1B_057]